MEPIPIVYDKYENEIGFTQETTNEEDHVHKPLPGIDTSRKITFYTWGKRLHAPIECDLVFDASSFSARTTVDVRSMCGLDDVVQQSILNHPNFDLLIERVIGLIEEKQPITVGIFCNYGKHRSVAWTELLKKLYYPDSICVHQFKN